MADGPEAIDPDYDDDPERFGLARRVLRDHGVAEDIHGRVAERVVTERLIPLLDVGCGDGALARHLPRDTWVGIDSSAEMLRRGPPGGIQAEATALPFADASFGSVALLYVLYHLPEPRRALEEAHRVVRRGGLVAAAAPSRRDSPELADLLPRAPLTFDAEIAPRLLSDCFDDIECHPWDAPLLVLPDTEAVTSYLIGKGVSADRAAEGAHGVDVPLTVTKRGTLVFGRKR